MNEKNKVNLLDGKNWLRNAINFYSFDTFDINIIQEKFKNFCFKKRVSGKTFLLSDNYKLDNYDFTFQYIKKLNSINDAFDIIINSAYDSYHILLLDDTIIDNYLVSKIITDFINDYEMEYRGKIIIHIEDTLDNKVAFMILNRSSIKTKYKNKKIDKYLIKTSLKNSYVINSKTKIDKIGLKHPAPYSYNDIEKITEIENISNKVILDPFLGVGSTILGTYKNNYNIGIELNKEYIDLIDQRIDFLKLSKDLKGKYEIINGDSLKKIKTLKTNIDVVITSPPYFNILKNKSKGVRHDNSQSRQGVEYYSNSKDDIGNIDEYDLYLKAMTKIFKDCYSKMNSKGKFYLIISDFTIDKKEKDIHSDMILCLQKAGFIYNTTSYLFQNQKVIYPFGYPFKIVLNHIFQYVIIFEKGDTNESK